MSEHSEEVPPQGHRDALDWALLLGRVSLRPMGRLASGPAAVLFAADAAVDIARLEGEIDLQAGTWLPGLLTFMLRGERAEIDLGHVSFADVVGLESLATAIEHLRQGGTSVQVTGASPEILRTVRILRLERFFATETRSHRREIEP